MLCRGYGGKAGLYIRKKPLNTGEMVFAAATLSFIVLSTVIIYLHP
jgi:cobalt/nickel transport system permease protein